MTYSRFKQLWMALIQDRPTTVHVNPIVMAGSSPHTVDALVAASDGDFSAFDRIAAKLAVHDARSILHP